MTFTKTSQWFGQWYDVRANTVWGLGFESQIELNKVSDLTGALGILANVNGYKAKKNTDLFFK